LVSRHLGLGVQLRGAGPTDKRAQHGAAGIESVIINFRINTKCKRGRQVKCIE
jgi:hypothetical protein